MIDDESKKIPLFDALAHPTMSGRWLGRNLDATFETLISDLTRSGFCGACAVGMSGVEGYDHDEFAARCKEHDSLAPIAGIDPLRDVVSPGEMARLATLGYRGIKLHPRLVGLTRRLDAFADSMKAAADAGLVVFYCTYLHCAPNSYPIEDPIYGLARLIDRAPDVRMVLVHGGDVRLLEYAEMTRFNSNLLLDLSLTFMKYAGSSIDHDIRFLFRQFDRRICIGTDHPEYRHAAVRDRFELFADGLGHEKAANVAHRNIRAFLGMKPLAVDPVERRPES